MSLPKYPEYKDSGAQWLGPVPSHWSVQSIKRLSSVQRGASPRPIDDAIYFDDDGEFSWVRIADVSASDGLLRATTQRLSKLGSELSVKIQPGELFVSIAGTVGKPCIAGIKACIHDGFVYFPRLNIPPKFLYRIFEAGTCYEGLGKFGTQLNLNTDTIGSILVATPPETELKQILEFLDRETSKIDTLIAEQEKLLTLLAEKRQATISHTVTKGLNPEAPMKDSGVEWLGAVPEHWQLKKIKHIGTVRYGIGEPPEYKPEGTYLIRATNIHAGKIYADGLVCVDPNEIPAQRIIWLKKGDILVVRSGAYTGDSAIVDTQYEGAIAGFDMVLRTHGCDPDFIQYSLLSRYLKVNQIDLCRTRAAQPHLNAEELGDCILLIPPINEQRHICQFLKDELSRLDVLASQAELATELLAERRSALIAAAVTGQIDVRDAVAEISPA